MLLYRAARAIRAARTKIELFIFVYLLEDSYFSICYHRVLW